MSTFSASSAELVFAAFVAIDWGSKQHVVAALPANGGSIEITKLINTPEAVELWHTALCHRFPDGPIAVAIEQKRGAVIYMLSKYDHLVLFPVPPTMSAFFRHAFSPSGAKDDPSDARLLLDLLLHHRDRLSPVQSDRADTQLLRSLTEHRRGLVQQKVSIVQQLTDCLAQYFPQLHACFGPLDGSLAAAVLERWPSLQQVQRSHAGTLKRFLVAHCSWDNDRLAETIRQVQAAVPATGDEVVLEVCSRRTTSCLAQLGVLRDQIAAYDKRIAAVTADHPDAPIFTSFPGAGAALVPRLIACFGDDRNRWANASELQRFSGIAPVLVRSGNSCRISMRRACPKFFRQTFHEFAGHSIRFCAWAKRLYQRRLKGHKKNHHAAVRAVAFQWIRIAFRCWANHVPYDERIFLAAQDRHNSPFAPRNAAKAGIQFKSEAGFQKLTANH